MLRDKFVLASGNAGKLREFSAIFAEVGVDIIPQREFAIEDVDETGLSFVENAIIKARHASSMSGLPAIADDSGLEVYALKGAPGIYSARFSQKPGVSDATDQSNNQKLLEMLEGVIDDQRGARFVCVLTFMRHAEDPTPLIVSGFWRGRILQKPVGTGGFGYDPLFYIDELGCTSAELESAQKNKISHRGKAMKLLFNEMQQSGLC